MSIEASHEHSAVEGDKPRKVFLEVGLDERFGNQPLLFNKGAVLEDHDIYIGLDCDEIVINSTLIQYGMEGLQDSGKHKFFFIHADAAKVPLRQGSVDTVYFSNVFGSPAERREEFLSEASRVIKPTGQIVIFENITPEDADDWLAPESPSKVTLKDKLKENHFEIVEKIGPTDPGWESKLKEFGIRNTHGLVPGHGEPFILIAMPMENK